LVFEDQIAENRAEAETWATITFQSTPIAQGTILPHLVIGKIPTTLPKLINQFNHSPPDRLTVQIEFGKILTETEMTYPSRIEQIGHST
jgi:hypothetical protein